MWPALIGAGAALLGGMLNRESQEDANLANANAQREFAQMGIRWKVADAKAAGLHPLFALGGSGASFSPSFSVSDQGSSIAQAGQNLARAAEAVDPSAVELRRAQLEAVKAGAAKDYALAAAADAEAAITRQQGAVANPIAQAFPAPDPRHIQTADLEIDGQANARLSPPVALPPIAPIPGYLTRDVMPGFQRYQVPGIGEVILPAGSSMSESLEALENTVNQSAVLAANVLHYGPQASRRLEKLLRGTRAGRYWRDPVGAGVDDLRDWASGHGVPIRR